MSAEKTPIQKMRDQLREERAAKAEADLAVSRELAKESEAIQLASLQRSLERVNAPTAEETMTDEFVAKKNAEDAEKSKAKDSPTPTSKNLRPAPASDDTADKAGGSK